ncbi:MAG: DUF4403 family protein, partial [Bacteroidota bacterium]
MKSLLRSLTFVLLITACKSIKPEKPNENYQAAAIEKVKSEINVPIQLSIIDVQNTLNRYVKGNLYELKDYSQTGIEKVNLKVYKNNKIELAGKNSVVTSVVPIKIWTNLKAGSGLLSLNETADFSLNLQFATRFSVTKDWRVIAKTSPNGFKWTKKPKISLGGFDIPLDDILGDVIDKQQASLSKILDKEIGKYLEIRSYAEEAWASAYTLFELSEEYKTWLAIEPVDIAMTPIKSNKKYIETQIGITTYTETFIGEKPATKKPADLPSLRLRKTLPDDFVVNLTASVSHQYATEMLRKTFVGESYSFKEGKYNITLTDLEIFGSNEQLAVKVGMTGSLNGIVYLRGQPYFDKESQMVGLREVDFDLKTKNVLAKAAGWLMHQKFNKTIQENFQIPIKAEIDEASKQINQYLKGYKVNQYVTINGDLNELAP